MDGTILSQGSFVVPATIRNRILQVPTGVDWISVVNYTRQGTIGGASAFGFRYFWQRGMPAGSALVEYYANGGTAVTGNQITSGGFTLYDPSGQTAGALPLLSNPVATTASTNATQPVVSTASTAGLAVGSVVRMSNTAQTDVNGIDMVVGAVNAGVDFTLLTASNALATAPGAIGGAGFYRIVNTDPLFYPRNRYVTRISQAVNAQVGTSVAHGLTPGQQVRFSIPAASGMVQLSSTPQNNYLSATVVSVVDDYAFTINVDTTSFTAFTWPTIAQQPSEFPQVTPFGENTGFALTSPTIQVPTIGGQQINDTNTGILADSRVNTGFLGIILGTGGNGTVGGAAITGPAGSVAGDVVYWRVGKASFGGL